MSIRIVCAALLASIPAVSFAGDMTDVISAPKRGPQMFEMRFELAQVDAADTRMGLQGVAEMQRPVSKSVATFAGVRVIKTVDSLADYGMNPNDDVHYDHASAMAGIRFRW